MNEDMNTYTPEEIKKINAERILRLKAISEKLRAETDAKFAKYEKYFKENMEEVKRRVEILKSSGYNVKDFKNFTTTALLMMSNEDFLKALDYYKSGDIAELIWLIKNLEFNIKEIKKISCAPLFSE